MNKKQDLATVLLGIAVALIVWLTIINRDKTYGEVFIIDPINTFLSLWKELKRGILGTSLGNVTMFIPVGALFPLSFPWGQKLHRTILIGMGLSGVIEIIQLASARGCFDPGDIMLNMIGTIVGYGIYAALINIVKKNRNV